MRWSRVRAPPGSPPLGLEQPPARRRMLQGSTTEQHWTASRVWVPLTYFAGLMPLCLLLRLDNKFAVDWTNHLWMISYTGEYFRRHWAFPATLNTDQLI